MSKKWWIVIAVVVVVGGLGLVGYRYIGGQRLAIAESQEAMETAVVRRDTLRVTVDAAGSLAPSAEVSLAFPAGGRVAEVLVEEGQQVEAGDVLVRLDDAEAREAVAEAELQVAQAESDLALAQIEAEAGVAQADLDAAQAEYDETAALSARVGDQLASARINLVRAHDALAEAQEAYDEAWDPARDWELQIESKKDALEAERESTEQALRDAQLDLEEAQADYSLAVADISESEVRNAQEKVLNAQVALESEPLQLEQLENALEQARLQLESAQRALEETVLTAPVDSTVTSLDVESGEMVNASEPVVVLSDLAVLEVEVNLDETDVAQVAIGQEALVSVDAFPEAELTGEVTYIAPVAQVESGVVLYPVTIRLAPTDPSASSGQAVPVRAGMTADVEIVTASQEDALIVPLRAVHTEGEQAYVYRLVGGLTEQVEVALGMMTETEVEITSGMAEGDVVSVVAVPTQDSERGFGPMRMFGGGGED
jgi:HlyD family secretion protein